LRDHIIIFLTRNREEKADKRIDLNNYLTPEDWRIITETVTLLKSFCNQTKRLQSRAKEGSRGGLWETYTSIELLINHIKQAKMQCNTAVNAQPPAPEDEIVAAARKTTKISLDNCWDKLNKYYGKYDETPVYAAADVLHPGLK